MERKFPANRLRIERKKRKENYIRLHSYLLKSIQYLHHQFLFNSKYFVSVDMILTRSVVLGLLGSTSLALASPVAELAEGSRLTPRGSACSYSGSSGAAAAIAGKAGCSSITLNNVVVPAGTTLDLTGLASGTKVKTPSKPVTLLLY